MKSTASESKPFKRRSAGEILGHARREELTGEPFQIEIAVLI